MGRGKEYVDELIRSESERNRSMFHRQMQGGQIVREGNQLLYSLVSMTECESTNAGAGDWLATPSITPSE